MGSVMVRQSDNQQRGSYLRACLRLCLLFMAGVAFWVLLAAGSAGPGMLATPVAKAVPAYQHSAAQDCTDCHTNEQHGQQDCTTCHSATKHPDYPKMPETCTQCHAAATFATGQDCTECHAGGPGTPGTAGKTDNDIHDSALPDGPIGPAGCTTCHPGRTEHAGKVACTTCHDSAEAFHHGNASSPGYPDCRSCHADKPKPAAGRSCQTCHKGAQHQAQPQVGSCTSCHGTARARHAGKVACTTCHDSAEACHHGNASSPGYPDCRPRHAEKPKPAAGRSCQTCHKGAQHQAQPQVGSCSSCHGTGRARHAGKVACTTCHGDPNKTHHNRIPSPPSCTSCHEQQLHDGRVPCVWCHGSKAMHDSTPLNLLTLSAAKSQNNKGSARDRVCTQCHVEATAHAGDTPAGVDHSCATCHEGEVHGPITSPEVQRCMDCHGAADKHALQHDCKRCHWPAIHNGTPDAGVGGGQKKMKLYLPAGSAGGVTDSGRTRLVDTGADLIPIALAGILLLGSGIYLRKKRL